MRAIGHIESCFRKKRGCPRQAGLCPAARGRLRLRPDIVTGHALDGLGEYSHVWLLWVFHQNTVSGKARTSVKAKIRPPKARGKRVGLFSTRTPHRPNPVGLSLVRLEGVDIDPVSHVGTLHFGNLDLVDGTPILDVKPYLRRFESLAQGSTREPAWVESSGDAPPQPVRFSSAVTSQLPSLVKHTRFYRAGGGGSATAGAGAAAAAAAAADDADDGGDAADAAAQQATALASAVSQMLALDIRSGAAKSRMLAADPSAAAEREEEEFCFGFDGLQFLCQSRGGQLEVFSVNVANADADTASTGP